MRMTVSLTSLSVCGTAQTGNFSRVNTDITLRLWIHAVAEFDQQVNSV